MRTSGRLAGRFAGALVVVAALAGVAMAETVVSDLPTADIYVVSALIVPGNGGAEVCSEKGQDHVDFRIGFGADQRILVNGTDVGQFDPDATYSVVVECRKLGEQWQATTLIVNHATGAHVSLQVGYVIAGGADSVRVVAENVICLTIR